MNILTICRKEMQSYFRSPIAYATSFKCPTRLYYGSREYYLDDESRRTALLARVQGAGATWCGWERRSRSACWRRR